MQKHGSLGLRAEEIRRCCIEQLGAGTFGEAYQFLQQRASSLQIDEVCAAALTAGFSPRAPHPQGLKTKGRGASPKTPSPPSPDQSDHSAKKRNLQLGKSGRAIFGTPSFGSKTPSPPPPPLLKRSPPPPPPRNKQKCWFVGFGESTGLVDAKAEQGTGMGLVEGG